MSASIYLHPTAARDPSAIVRIEHATGRLAVIRPGDPAPRLERIRRVPACAEDRAGLMFLPLHGWPDGWLDDAPLGPGAA